jgi:transglutaminase-like putative cysteine protease
MMLDLQLHPAPMLDHSSVDLDNSERVTYLLEQCFRYDYAVPVRRLRHRLVVLPPRRHGDQHLRAHALEVDGTVARRVTRCDARGNTVVQVHAERVESRVEFRIQAVLERIQSEGPLRLPAEALTDPRLLRATRLTAADGRLRDLASDLMHAADTPRDRAERLCQAVHDALTYEYGVSSVSTTAAEALAGGRGVCQDSAHIMLALCHIVGLPARYVSGHLLGQGGTHAWVEAIVPEGDHAVAVAFDPSSGTSVSARYLTVATGRDYSDVRPTSGTYIGPVAGSLTTSRRVALLHAA